MTLGRAVLVLAALLAVSAPARAQSPPECAVCAAPTGRLATLWNSNVAGSDTTGTSGRAGTEAGHFACTVVVLALMLQSVQSVSTPGLTLEDLYSRLVSDTLMADSEFATQLPAPAGAGHASPLVDLPGAAVLFIAVGFATALFGLVPQFAAAFSSYAVAAI